MNDGWKETVVNKCVSLGIRKDIAIATVEYLLSADNMNKISKEFGISERSIRRRKGLVKKVLDELNISYYGDKKKYEIIREIGNTLNLKEGEDLFTYVDSPFVTKKGFIKILRELKKN